MVSRVVEASVTVLTIGRVVVADPDSPELLLPPPAPPPAPPPVVLPPEVPPPPAPPPPTVVVLSPEYSVVEPTVLSLVDMSEVMVATIGAVVMAERVSEAVFEVEAPPVPPAPPAPAAPEEKTLRAEKVEPEAEAWAVFSARKLYQNSGFLLVPPRCGL